jgi:two-component system chemotaxis response regulator CheB
MEVSLNADERARDVIVIGASAGGISALTELLSRLPADLPAFVGIVIHRGAHSASDWSVTLGRKTSLCVVQPAHGDRLTRGVAYVAPADHHMTFGMAGVRLDHGPKQQSTRPAVDPLFTSAGLSFGPRVVGVVLTGAGRDGSQGLAEIKTAGGLSLAQRPGEAEFPSMPGHAIAGGHVDAVLSLHELGDVLVLLARGSAVTVH